MVVSILDVKQYVGDSGSEYDDLLTGCLAEALALVTKYNRVKNPAYDGVTVTEEYIASDAPGEIVDRAVKEVAADLFNRRNAPNGIVNNQFANFGGDQGAVVRIARDPMQGAYKLLGRWVGLI